MTDQTLFVLCNCAVVPAWVLLLVAPHWRWTYRLAMFTLPMLLAALYIWLFIASFEGLHVNFLSLGAVQYALRSPAVVLAAWIHFLTFDLFVGAWMVRDARRMRIVQLAVIPCLLLTFLMGPVGLLIYLSMRSGLRRSADAQD